MSGGAMALFKIERAVLIDLEPAARFYANPPPCSNAKSRGRFRAAILVR